MDITLNTTKGTETFKTLRGACRWLEQLQPSGTTMTVNGREIEYDFDALPEFDADNLEAEILDLVENAAIAVDDDATLIPEMQDGVWTVRDQYGARFRPFTNAPSAGAALNAVKSQDGEWYGRTAA